MFVVRIIEICSRPKQLYLLSLSSHLIFPNPPEITERKKNVKFSTRAIQYLDEGLYYTYNQILLLNNHIFQYYYNPINFPWIWMKTLILGSIMHRATSRGQWPSEEEKLANPILKRVKNLNQLINKPKFKLTWELQNIQFKPNVCSFIHM